MDGLPVDPGTDPDEESKAVRLFHAIFGRGSVYNPGGSITFNTAGWGLVALAVFGPIVETFSGSPDAGAAWRGAPIVFLMGVLFVRASKKPPASEQQPDAPSDGMPL